MRQAASQKSQILLMYSFCFRELRDTEMHTCGARIPDPRPKSAFEVLKAPVNVIHCICSREFFERLVHLEIAFPQHPLQYASEILTLSAYQQ